MTGIQEQRDRMVERQIAARGVSDPHVLSAMRKVPREEFVPESRRASAYEDRPLPIGEGQTISQPFIVALMIEGAGVMPGDRVLEVGAGSGYAAAVMAQIGAQVFAIERHEPLVATAQERFDRLGYQSITLRAGDGSKGWLEHAPFDAILVAAASPKVPESLKRQLAIGGRLVIPVGEFPQALLRITRLGEDEFAEDDLGGVTFVPLIGEEGWKVGDS